jgi:hypothetical protein
MKFLACVTMLLTADAQLEAPVYSPVTDNVFRRSGSFQHDKAEGAEILFCITVPDRPILHCVVRTETDRLVVLELVASEHST